MNTNFLYWLQNIVFTIIATMTYHFAYGGDLYHFQKQTYTDDKLPPALMQQLYESSLSHYQEVDRIISEHLFEKQLKHDAQKSKKTIDQLRSELFNVENVDEKELKKFYEDNKSRIPVDYEKAKPQLIRYLKTRKSSAKRDEYLAKVKKSGGYQLLLPKPIAPVFSINTQGFPSKGTADAAVTIVEFFDYQCPHCREAGMQLRALLPRFKNHVRIINIDFPVNRSGISTLIAQGAYCAKEQDKYWEYHYLALSRQAELTAKSPAQLAAHLRLDDKKFSSCMASKKPLNFITRSKSEAQRLGLHGTPSFFVNGRKLIFSNLETDLVEAINAELVAQGKKPL